MVDAGYRFGEMSALALVEKYGAPLYVYDAEVIDRQYKRMVEAFSGVDLKINYACKALSNLSILKHIHQLGAGLDAVSIQEVQLGLRAGFQPQEILFTPNGVSMDEMASAVELGARITIDNLSMLEQIGQSHSAYPICIRLNPHILAGGNSKISTGHIDSKFGISFHQLPHVLRLVQTMKLTVEGLHMHTGSDILDAKVFLAGAEILLNAAREFDSLTFIDFGSGFKVPYRDEDIETDIEEVGAKVSERFAQFCKDYGRALTLMFEPGKFLVSESGFFYARVNVVKQTTANVFAAVDSGLNHLIRPMLYEAHHDIFNASKTEGKKRIYTVVGYICETDTFGVNRSIHEISEGDILCFRNAGAYCYSMASNYNSRCRPAEVMIREGKDHLIRERETFEDLVAGQIEI